MGAELPEAVLIAHQEPREHANGAPGTWWIDYRVRELTSAERDEVWRRTERLYSHVLEARYSHERDSEYCTHHTGKWQPWDYGDSPEGAALSCIGDSSYQEATSLSPLHVEALRVLKREQARNRYVARLRDLTHYRLFCGEWREIDVRRDERDRAEDDYHDALKRARLYSAAMRGDAPPDKLAPIQEACRKRFYTRTVRRIRIHDAALARLRELEAAP